MPDLRSAASGVSMRRPSSQANGRKAAFERLAFEHLDGLYNFALAFTADPAKAEEVVVETYLRADAQFRESAFEDGFKVWMFTLLRKEAAKKDGAGTGSTSGLLAIAPEETRLAVMLFVVEGFSTAEIADIMGYSVRATRSRIRLGLERLRSHLAESEAVRPHAFPHERRSR